MSDDGIVKFQVIVEFDALRSRFDKKMIVYLEVWDEIRGEFIRVTQDVNGQSPDLNRPGEGFRNLEIKILEDD